MFNNEKFRDLLKKTKVPENMISRGLVGLNDFIKPMEILLSQQQIPEKGWTDDQIRFFLSILSHMDSNNDEGAYCIGEREGRISTPLLNELSGGFIHGIGRSGDIKAPQPKATGGSILNSLTDIVVYNFIKDLGLENIKGAITLPLSTGMSIMLTLRAFETYVKQNNYEHYKNEIIFPRIDHNSPLKGIITAGMKPIIIEGFMGKEQYQEIKEVNKKTSSKKTTKPKSELENQDVTLNQYIAQFGTESIYINPKAIESSITDRTFAILSTTTFFPPRAPDYVKEIAKIAKKHNIYHIINNAYGVQSPEILKIIRGSIDAGRVDAIIQSTDKNFLTPIGGSIITSPDPLILKAISQAYAGRGSASPILHLLVSLLSMGKNGYQKYIQDQISNKSLLDVELYNLAISINERVLNVHNPIASAMTLNNLNEKQIESLGGYLYNLRVTGPRVINSLKGDEGSCYDNYPDPYIVMNAAIGATKEDIEGAINQLRKGLQQVQSLR
jgi:O-phospho-L-seryl-tRNASec:L-selenocysteinyl-tRNA synthase